MLGIPNNLSNFLPKLSHECETHTHGFVWVLHPSESFGKKFDKLFRVYNIILFRNINMHIIPPLTSTNIISNK